jgi:hypothetical protein
LAPEKEETMTTISSFFSQVAEDISTFVGNANSKLSVDDSGTKKGELDLKDQVTIDTTEVVNGVTVEGSIKISVGTYLNSQDDPLKAINDIIGKRSDGPLSDVVGDNRPLSSDLLAVCKAKLEAKKERLKENILKMQPIAIKAMAESLKFSSLYESSDRLLEGVKCFQRDLLIQKFFE